MHWNRNMSNTSPATQKERLESLRREINFHNYRYHVLDDPVISDSEFDQLIVQLRQMEAEHPDWITPDSPSQRLDGFHGPSTNRIGFCSPM